MKTALVALVMSCVCVTHVAMAADDGLTQPKVNTVSNNSFTTATDLIATTSGSGNVKGVSCALEQDVGDNFAGAIVKFYVNGGSAQSVTLNYLLDYDPGVVGLTGWVPFNVRFTSSIRVTIQKTNSQGGQIKCAVSWGLD